MANIPGFPGYQGWDQTAAEADFKATGGAGKGGPSGGSSGGGSNQIKAADLVKLEQQVADSLKGYYTQLLSEANGDLQVAKNKLLSDYTTGTRNARIAYTTGTTDELANLVNTLQSNSITNLDAQNKELDNLNQRGAAVYQQGPEGALNVLGVHLPVGDASENAVTDVNAGTTPLYTNPNIANLGQGGQEMQRFQQDQQLRQEAQQRAANQKLQSLGITYKAATNTPSGYDLSTPAGVASAATDVNHGKVQTSDFGSEGQTAINAYNTAQIANRTTRENLANQEQQQVFQQGSALAGTQAKSEDVAAQSKLNQEEQQSFINQGAT